MAADDMALPVMSRPKRARRARWGLLRESVHMALAALRANKLRTSLTLLGIVIGVGTVVAMAAVLSGMDRGMARSIAALGSGAIYLTKYEAAIQINGTRREERPDLTLDDAEDIARTIPGVTVSPNTQSMAPVSWRENVTKSLTINGCGADELVVSDRRLQSGRFFTREEMIAARNVAVLGPDVADVLFGSIDPLGRQVRIGGISYQVIGILTEKGSVLGNNLDEIVEVPVTAQQRQHGWGKVLDYITILPPAPEQVTLVRDQIEALMRRRHKLKTDAENDFGMTTQENLLDLYNKLTRAIFAVMLLVSGIALLVGGIGIMNMMLVTVRERTREIGIRRAVGARRGDVLLQFLTEAITLTLCGGATGLLLGAIFAVILAAVSPLPAALPVSIVVVALALAVGVGLFFGLYPAWRAARQNPIEALRYE